MDLVEFVRARLDDDERIARASIATVGPHATGEWEAIGGVQHVGGYLVASAQACWDGGVEMDEEDAEHIAHWDPARVLAEVEAKRRLLSLALGCSTCGMHPLIPHACSGIRTEDALDLDDPCDPWRAVILALAQPYADHADFRPEWRLT